MGGGRGAAPPPEARFFLSTAQEALELALTLIPKDRTVSWGGTATAAQIGLMDRLHQGDYQLIDRDTGKTPEEKAGADAPGP